MSEEQESTEESATPVETPEEKPEVQAKEEKKQVSTPLIDSVNAAAERIEKATKEAEEVGSRLESIYAQMQLAGRGDASISQPQKKELTEEEYAKKFMSGEIGFSK